MKKSKIIIPALGVILLTTAASVSGTVAWFLANKDVVVSAASFKVNNIDGSLDAVAVAGVGTTASQKVVTVAENSELTDGSFDHTSKKAVRLNKSTYNLGNGNIVYDDLGVADPSANPQKWLISTGTDGVKYYAAVSFAYELTYTFQGASEAQDLYFDWKTSTLTGTSSESSNSEDTKYAFRIFMYTDTNSILWSNHDLEGAAPTYVTAAHKNQEGIAYASPVQVLAEQTAEASQTDIKSLKDKGEPSADQLKLKLGQFTTATGGNKITVNCVAWFEGTDVNVKNGAKMAKMAASLAFSARTTKGA